MKYSKCSSSMSWSPPQIISQLQSSNSGTETPVQSDSILLQNWEVFAPKSPFRRAVVPGAAKPSRNTSKKPTIKTATGTSVDQALPCSRLRWTERFKHVFDIGISVCPLCGGTLRVIADVTDPDATQTILAHLRHRAP